MITDYLCSPLSHDPRTLFVTRCPGVALSQAAADATNSAAERCFLLSLLTDRATEQVWLSGSVMPNKPKCKPKVSCKEHAQLEIQTCTCPRGSSTHTSRWSSCQAMILHHLHTDSEEGPEMLHMRFKRRGFNSTTPA